MAHCSVCKQEIECPGHDGFGHKPLDQSVLPCARTCSIWVRAVDESGTPVPGLSAKASGKSDETKGTGFAKLEDLPVGKNTVDLALTDLAAADYQPLATDTRTEKLAKGDLKLITVTVKARVKPVLDISAPAVAVGGKTATITLSTDPPYDGKGTFTCTAGADKLEFTPSLEGGKLDYPAFAGPQTITVKALDSSALEGIAFEWKIDPAVQKGPPATGKMTAVKAELKVFKKAGTELSKTDKSGDGRTVHLQKPGKKWTRAKTEVVVLPAEYDGHVWLTLTKPTLELYDKAEDGTAADLLVKIAVGPGKKLEYFAGGISLSDSKADTALELKIDELSDTIDTCNFTVMETTLQICAPRPDADTEPPAMPDDKKFTAGRTLYKQRTKLTGQRALLRVTKSPLDAPCKLNLKATAGGDRVVYYEAGGEKDHVDMTTSLAVKLKHSNENPVEGVAGKSFPREIAVDEVKDLIAASHKVEEKHLHRGLVFWLEGVSVSTPRQTQLQIDADEVDDLCDAVACTVAKPKLNIEISRKDTLALVADVDCKLTAPGKDVALVSGLIPKGTGKLSLEVEAGFYGIAVTPKNAAEKEMRLMRTEPTDSETSLAVFADTTVKFELLPPYEKVQCIAYFMRTGAYLGVDAQVVAPLNADDLRTKKRIQALNDIDARCAIMKDAVVKAYTATGVKSGDAKILKIFMAPEFYFRGKQGAYPLETMSEILTPPKDPVMANIQALKTELDNAKYNDWLFVLGSAIGAIELESDPQRTEVSGQITAIEPKVTCDVWLRDTSPACAAAAGWGFYVGDTDPFETITGSVLVETKGSHKRYRLEFAADLDFDTDMPVALSEHGFDTVTFFKKRAVIQITSAAAAPLAGWDVKQGSTVAEILNVAPLGLDQYRLTVDLDDDENLTAGAAKVKDGSTSHAADITAVDAGAIFVDHAGGSVAANAAANWRFWNDPGGPPFPIAGSDSFLIEQTQVGGLNRKILIFPNVIVLDPTDVLAVGDLYPVAQLVTEKLVTIEVQFGAPVTVAKGHFFEKGGVAKGLVESATSLGANKYRLAIWLPLEAAHGLTLADTVEFTTPSNAEILNVALVRKGGAGAPVRADGGAQKELLVYKETISSVDFEGMDYSRGAFYRDDRQAIKLYGDPARKTFPTVGAAGSTSENKPGATTSSGARITETNRSGLGGGSIFTMDGITFGLEVCLDHGEKKLKKYFDGTPVPGEPRIQVQLIPSCGMGIDPDAICTVADGIIFNVDAYKYACKKDGGGAAGTEIGNLALNPAGAATYFITTETAKKGFIKVFEEIDKPTPGVV